ncbi:Transcriptional regulatory protein ZraR [Thiorhodovibrio winogradskyi]|uniref:Transcriptional regulatory protein ZraR n=1 Tax=Thiorhodovibrio winogradskyi TaxID=77007 RepID=A0ABZ0SA74_9GAMM|nr:sigma-54 dependent transcriptional regulator [Thiorhodovibrio winogradskyi]
MTNAETAANNTGQVASILVVEDDHGYRQLLIDELADAGYRALGVADAEAARAVLTSASFALVLCDLRLPGADGLAVLQASRACRPQPGFIMVTGFGTIDQAVAALKAGADDFLTKPLDLEHLRLTVARVLDRRQLQVEVARYRELLGARDFHGMLGKSPAMLKLFELIRRIAPSHSSVLITGESGTGKELVARALHQESTRAEAPFVALNCAGIPETLLESELFGHAAGAFSGARAGRRGLFLEADGGTLFLDEIAEMPPAMQTKLLRLLQDGQVRPVGANQEIAADVRILAATHQNPSERIAAGELRQDLFYRLETFRLHVPPLRERGEDIAHLLRHFLGLHARAGTAPEFAPEAWRALLDYAFPGNVRELGSLVERLVTLAAGARIEFHDLPERVRQASPTAADATSPAAGAREEDWRTLAEVEASHIRAVLDWTGGNKQRAARILGIGRKTLYRKLGERGPDDP